MKTTNNKGANTAFLTLFDGFSGNYMQKIQTIR